jgi:hypothetical protein
VFHSTVKTCLDLTEVVFCFHFADDVDGSVSCRMYRYIYRIQSTAASCITNSNESMTYNEDIPNITYDNVQRSLLAVICWILSLKKSSAGFTYRLDRLKPRASKFRGPPTKVYNIFNTVIILDFHTYAVITYCTF